MSGRVGYRWHLRRMMADRGMYQTTELVPLLADRGVALSREQVYRLATGVPQRLNLHVLAALCDILGCQPGELIECHRGAPAEPTGAARPQAGRPTPRRARVTRDDDDG
ncbi:MAG TPA: helix-turn-helix transcriptional regulator [Euzebya sp.]|nr:helix-turn-helix transcriptional regulator [Euzebya sp.]